MKNVKAVHSAVSAPIDDLVTFRALPTARIPMDKLNPFIFLNHHGPQVYPPNNNGLPFGPHPHRGMETVTFILDGDIQHEDSGGSKSIIKSGGIQWMTAGKGLIHAEVSSEEFKKNGGPLEILQLWLNLPADKKMDTPFYKGLQKDEIPEVQIAEGVRLQIISGEWDVKAGPFNSGAGVNLYTIKIDSGSKFTVNVPVNQTIFLYVVRGKINVNGTDARVFQVVEFEPEETEFNISAVNDSLLIFGFATPLNEPVIAQGPFVMNSYEEIEEAYMDYRKGNFGSWQ